MKGTMNEAKKTEPTSATAEAKKKPGAGQKACPECGEIMGTRKQECSKCHHKFERGAGGKKTKLAPADLAAAYAQVSQQASKVQQAGGVEALEKHLAAVDAAESALEPFGGIEAARVMVAALKAVAAATTPTSGKQEAV